MSAAKMNQPRYPAIWVQTRSQNPLTLIAAVRQAMRQAHVEKAQIQEFSQEVFDHEDPFELEAVCREWVNLETTH